MAATTSSQDPVAAAAKAFLYEFHGVGDSLNADAWGEYFTNDAIVKMGNNPPFEGRENFLKVYSYQTGMVEMMKHDIHHFDVVGDRIYHQATLSYIVKGDPKKEVIKLNAFAIIHRNKNNKIYKLEIYNDPAPLMTRVQAVMLGPA